MRIPVISTLWQAGQYWGKDRASYLGAAIAYNALFSIAPLLIIAIGAVGMFYGEVEVKTKLIDMAKEHIGGEGAAALQDLVEQFWRPTTSFWASIAGPIILVITACNFYLSLETALHLIWNLPIVTPTRWFYPYLRSYFLAFVMVVLSSCYVLIVIVSDGLMTYLIKSGKERLPGGEHLWNMAHLAIYIVLLTLMFIFTFRFMSHRRIPYRKLLGGAIVAALLFLVGRLLFGWYISYMGNSLATAFGASSSVVIFLIWVYYSAQIVFYGAEVVKVHLEGMK